MTNDRLIIWCGDSWVAGNGLVERKANRFASLVPRHIGCGTINLSQSASAIGHLRYKIDQICRIIERYPQTKVQALFGLTVPSRLCVCTESGALRSVSVNSFDRAAFVSWAHHVFDNRHVINETCMALSWVSDQCKKKRIPFKFFNILCNWKDFSQSKFSKFLDPNDWLIDPYWSVYGEIFDIANFDFQKMSVLAQTSYGKRCMQKYIIPNDGHPNILGHNKIFTRMIDPVKELL